MKIKMGICIIAIAILLGAEEITKNINFGMNDLSFTKQDGYDCVSIKEAWSNFEAGRPNLPVKVVNLVIPSDAEVKDLQFTSNQVEIPGDYKIMPVQKPLGYDTTGEINPPHLYPLPRGERIWKEDSSKIYPEVIAQISNIGYFAGNKIVSIIVYPVQYLAIQGKLILNKNVQLKIKYQRRTYPSPSPTRGEGVEILKRIRQDKINVEYNNKIEKVIRRFIDNPEDFVVPVKQELPEVIVAEKFLPMELPSALGSSVQYVIITNNELAPYFQIFADWKLKKGVPTVIKTVSWIESHYNGTDIQEKIRNFIKDAYQKWGIDYVLIGGDEGVVPTRIASLNFYGNHMPFVPTDVYYSCLDGNWNKNNNEYFGEALDSIDLYPEVFVGRLPVNNASEAKALITKIINYEQHPASGFIPKALFLGEKLGFLPTDGKDLCDSIADYFIPPNYTITKLYEYNGNENRSLVMQAINQGYGIIHFQGHGDPNCLGVGPDFLFHPDFDTLKNQNKYSIWYGQSCYISRFTCDCIAEHFVRSPNGGGVAFIASSTNDFPFDNLIFDKRFYQFFFDSSFYKIGEALALSKASLIGYYQWWEPYQAAMTGRILLGDPEMPVWTEEPANTYVTHPNSVGLGPQDFLVKVEIDNPEVPGAKIPVANARVCVMKDNEFYAYGWTNTQGQVIFRICPESSGAISVVATKHNYKTYTGNCDVLPNNPYVSYAGHSVEDSLGNNNKIPDAGEDVFLTMTLKNSGIGSAEKVIATLSTASPYITIIDSTEEFGTIPAGQLVSKENAYRILLNPDILDQTKILFSLKIWANHNNYSYSDNFEIEISSPILLHFGHPLSKVTNTQYRMLIKIRNDGCGEDNGVWARLGSIDPRVTIIKDSLIIGAVNGRTEVLSSDSFLFETPIPLESIADFRLLIKDRYNREFRDTFVIRTPPYPYNLGYQPYQNEIYLTWDIVPNHHIFGFNVYRFEDGEWKKANETVITNGRYFIDTDLTPATEYRYFVTSVDSSMNERSSNDTLLTATNPKLKPGWPKVMEFDSHYSSPFACELDPDYPGLEIVSIDRMGTIYAWHCDGTGLISQDGVFARTNMKTWTSPAAGDIDLDGKIEIIYLGSQDNPPLSKLFVYKPNGSLMWSNNVANKWTVSAPLICQFDRDRYLEIIAALNNGDVYLYQHNGQKRLFAACTSQVFSSPAYGDVNQNGRPEVWIGTKLKGIYSWENDGTRLFSGWPNNSNYHDFSSIVIGDIVKSNPGLEIVTIDRYCHNAYLIDKNGNTLPGWPFSFSLWDLLASPSLANLDDDEDLEIIISNEPMLFAFNNDGTIIEGFPAQRLTNACSNPVIVDIDNDQDYEVIVGSSIEDDRFYGFHHNGKQVLGFPIPVEYGALSSAYIGNIDNDNRLEMVVSAHDHNVYIYELDQGVYYSNCLQWPTYRHDLWRTGNYGTRIWTRFVDDSLATAPNSSRKLVCNPSGTKQHYVFSSNNSIWYTNSIDRGTNWAPDTSLGDGSAPAIALDTLFKPCVTWADGNNIFYTRMGSIWIPPWCLHVILASEPAILVSPNDTAFITHAHYLSTCTPGVPLCHHFPPDSFLAFITDTIGDYIAKKREPSVSIASDNLGNIHIAFVSQDNEIWYSVKEGAIWKTPINISNTPDLSTNCFIDCYGDSVIIVWSEVVGDYKEIYKRARNINGPYTQWNGITNISQSPKYESDYPQIVAGDFVTYSEMVDNNWEIYLRRLSTNEVFNISNTLAHSKFSQIAFSQTWLNSNLYFLWTEGNQIPYEIKYKQIRVSNVPYYVVGVGLEIPSSYTVYRDGYITYPSGYTIDYGNDTLIYRLPYLNPNYEYKLGVTGYHETEGTWLAQIKVDGGMAGVIRVKSGIPDSVQMIIPLSYYQNDHEVRLRIKRLTGEFAGIQKIVLYQFARVREEGGLSSMMGAEAGISPKTFALFQNTPNPFNKFTKIRYQLPVDCRVSLKIYNTAGQMVRTLVDGEQKIGYYAIFWNGTDNNNRKLADGVYFYKFQGGDFTATKKMILTR
ncbi:MAG: C25 family cysteine peptidase [candidate division WOR-3 bacterium]